ncbi:MAG: hypothetical protein ACI9VS_001908 [Candidatus Binatia bacterium]|jgi:hypothetical protein
MSYTTVARVEDFPVGQSRIVEHDGRFVAAPPSATLKRFRVSIVEGVVRLASSSEPADEARADL